MIWFILTPNAIFKPPPEPLLIQGEGLGGGLLIHIYTEALTLPSPKGRGEPTISHI